jgi:hypothetical protein
MSPPDSPNRPNKSGPRAYEREDHNMKMRVKLSTTEDIRRFVEIASRYRQNMELVLGRYVVDAKSILGILSLDLSKPLDLVVSDYVDGLESDMHGFLAA